MSLIPLSIGHRWLMWLFLYLIGLFPYSEIFLASQSVNCLCGKFNSSPFLDNCIKTKVFLAYYTVCKVFDFHDKLIKTNRETALSLLKVNIMLNSHVPQQKTYLSFGTDLAHVIDVTESLIFGNQNVDQNVQLEWEIFFYQWTVWA